MPTHDVQEDEQYFDPDSWSLWGHLEETRDHWGEVYRAYWELDDDQPRQLEFETWELAKKYDVIAEAIYRVASDLRVPGKNEMGVSIETLKSVREMVSIYAEVPNVKNRLELELSKDVLPRLKIGAERIFDVFELITYAPSQTFPAEYLTRATRLYLLGCDLECLILCRCALEAALKHEIDDAVMLRRVGPKQKSRKGVEFDYSLEQYLVCAQAERRLIGAALSKAHQLRMAANDAIHGLPMFARTEVPGAMDALQNLAELLSVLFCNPSSPPTHDGS